MPKVAELGKGVFAGCSSLEYLELPEGTERIDSIFFSGCQNLKSIKIPASVREIDDYLIYSVPSLQTIYTPEGSYAEEYMEWYEYIKVINY